MNKNNILKLEKRFLAYLFSNKRYIAMSLGRINHTYLPNTGYIYRLLIAYYNKYQGIITDEVVDTMFEKRNLNTNVIVTYKSIINEVKALPIHDDAEFEAIMEDLNEYRKRQELLSIAENIIENNPIDCSSDDLKKIEKSVSEKMTLITADNSETRKEGSIKESVKERKERYKKIKENPESIITYPTGFKVIDNAEGGFRPGELVYVIGRKGDGKSVLMLNLAHNLWNTGRNVILFSLEISKEDYERRFDSRAVGISSNGLKRGTLTEVEEALYDKYLTNLEENKNMNGNKAGTFYVVDVPGGCSPAHIETKIEMVEQLLNIKFDVCVADYAGIMVPNVSQDAKRHDQGQIALDLKRIARKRDMCVISAAQMTRAGKDEDKADTAHVAESDQISDHIDWGIAIRSLNEKTGKIESFKTRDAAPFCFSFTKKYSCMTIIEMEDSLSSWDQLSVTI